MSADIKAFVTHVLKQVTVWMRFYSTYRGTHYESELRSLSVKSVFC
jgi:hypothetical protein